MLMNFIFWENRTCPCWQTPKHWHAYNLHFNKRQILKIWLRGIISICLRLILNVMNYLNIGSKEITIAWRSYKFSYAIVRPQEVFCTPCKSPQGVLTSVELGLLLGSTIVESSPLPIEYIFAIAKKFLWDTNNGDDIMCHTLQRKLRDPHHSNAIHKYFDVILIIDISSHSVSIKAWSILFC